MQARYDATKNSLSQNERYKEVEKLYNCLP